MSLPHSPGIALITGASAGIGATYADRLARRGHPLVLVARDKARLESLAGRLGDQHGVAVEVLPADLTNAAERAAVEARLRDDPAIDTLVNNAGMAVAGTVLTADVDALERMIMLNTVAPTRLAAAAMRGFVARGRGTLINVASVLAVAPERFNSVYSGTKAHLLNLSLGLAQEGAASGVRVQAVLPGATRTEIWERAGVDVESLPPDMVMGVEEMVDAALAGLDQGEAVTIPSLPDMADWEAFTLARLQLGPNLSRSRAADRYKIPTND